LTPEGVKIFSRRDAEVGRGFRVQVSGFRFGLGCGSEEHHHRGHRGHRGRKIFSRKDAKGRSNVEFEREGVTACDR
jgi:hypothetical protein